MPGQSGESIGILRCADCDDTSCNESTMNEYSDDSCFWIECEGQTHSPLDWNYSESVQHTVWHTMTSMHPLLWHPICVRTVRCWKRIDWKWAECRPTVYRPNSTISCRRSSIVRVVRCVVWMPPISECPKWMWFHVAETNSLMSTNRHFFRKPQYIWPAHRLANHRNQLLFSYLSNCWRVEQCCWTDRLSVARTQQRPVNCVRWTWLNADAATVYDLVDVSSAWTRHPTIYWKIEIIISECIDVYKYTRDNLRELLAQSQVCGRRQEFAKIYLEKVAEALGNFDCIQTSRQQGDLRELK